MTDEAAIEYETDRILMEGSENVSQGEKTRLDLEELGAELVERQMGLITDKE